MASITDDEESNRGSMWVLDQKLDQPMEEEAVRLKNMYREKVPAALFCTNPTIILYYCSLSIVKQGTR